MMTLTTVSTTVLYCDVLDVSCAQLTRDLFAIAKFLFIYVHIVTKFSPVVTAKNKPKT